MKLEEALKIWSETGRLIRPIDKSGSNFQKPDKWVLSERRLNEEWEVESEPKKTVVMYKFAYKHKDDDVWNECTSFYKNERDFLNTLVAGAYDCKRLDYTATEFEV